MLAVQDKGEVANNDLRQEPGRSTVALRAAYDGMVAAGFGQGDELAAPKVRLKPSPHMPSPSPLCRAVLKRRQLGLGLPSRVSGHDSAHLVARLC